MNAARILLTMGILGLLACNSDQREEEARLRVLLVTGGTPIRYHKILVPTSFYTVLEDSRDMIWDHASLDEAAFENDIRDQYDVLVFSNRSDSLSNQGVENLRLFIESGKGIIIMHSALSSYNNWEWWWRDVVGGKYQMRDTDEFPKSGYYQDEGIFFSLASEHPINAAVGEFTIVDEIYNRLNISPTAQVVYQTDNSNSDGPVVWIGPHEKSRIVVIQPGHSAEVYRHPKFKSLIQHAILWAGES